MMFCVFVAHCYGVLILLVCRYGVAMVFWVFLATLLWCSWCFSMLLWCSYCDLSIFSTLLYFYGDLNVATSMVFCVLVCCYGVPMVIWVFVAHFYGVLCFSMLIWCCYGDLSVCSTLLWCSDSFSMLIWCCYGVLSVCSTLLWCSDSFSMSLWCCYGVWVFVAHCYGVLSVVAHCYGVLILLVCRYGVAMVFWVFVAHCYGVLSVCSILPWCSDYFSMSLWCCYGVLSVCMHIAMVFWFF